MAKKVIKEHPKRKRRVQLRPPEVMHSYTVRMPPSLYLAVTEHAKKLGVPPSAMWRSFAIQGLAGGDAPVADWWFKREDEIEVDDDNNVEERLLIDLKLFGEIITFQRKDGFQSRRKAILELIRQGIKASNNRGTGIGGRY